jgi:TolB-like protein/Tfp pilus assembly protein PilF
MASQQLPADVDSLARALASRYRIERELGVGGMATVYLAEDLKHHRQVAIKVLKPELAAVLGPDRFLREIETAAKLNHPHILPLLESGEAGRFLYYAMPYVEGESLRDRLKRERQLPLEDALAITREVADALDYAHRRAVVHRDIKPENILLQERHAVVADFGIARAISVAGGETLTATGVVVGTPQYMSPEQARGRWQLDGRSDVYALGCVLYEMLAGQPPFTGLNAQTILARHTLDPVPPLRTVRPTVPPTIERAVTRALEKTPADRFDTAASFSAALVPVSLPTPTGIRSPRWLRWVVAGLAAIVLFAGAWWMVQRARANSAPIHALAVLPLANLMGPEQEYFVEGMHDALIGELSQIGALSRVISRTSVMRYKGAGKSIPEIAKELGVDAVVEGSVFQAGDSVRIQIQVIRAVPREHHLWAGTFDGELRNALAVQKNMVSAIAREIRVGLAPQEQTRLAGARVVEPEAYKAYLRGQYFRNRWQAGGCQAAQRDFEDAIKLDSTFADAYASLAYCYMIAGPSGPSLVELGPQARAAVTRALELDENLAAAHVVLAFLRHRLDYDWIGAEREFRRALALNPNDPDALWFFGEYLYTVGRSDDGLAMVRRATELDPFNLDLNVGLGFGFFILGRYDEAIAQFEKTLELDPNWLSAKVMLARAYAAKGSHDQAVTHYLAALMGQYPVSARADPNRVAQSAAALRDTYTRSGWRPFWERVLDLCRDEVLVCRPYWIAHQYAYLGDRDAAVAALEAAYAQRSIHAVFMDVDALFKSLNLRSNSRFQELLRRMNLPK